MPNMNGIEFLKEFKKLQRKDSPTIIMITTEAGLDLVMKAKAYGVKGWLIKPFRSDKLDAYLKKYLEDAA